MGIKERKEREKAQRRETILKAAEKLYVKHGYDRLTMDKVAEEAELNKATIYLYFKNKNDLFHGLVNKGLLLLYEKVKRHVETANTGLEKIIAVAKAYREFYNEEPHYSLAINHKESKDGKTSKVNVKELPYYQKTDETGRKIFGVVIEAFSQGKRDGSMRKDVQPAVEAVHLWGYLTGLFMILQKKPEVIEDLLGVEKEAILKNLTAHIRHIYQSA